MTLRLLVVVVIVLSACSNPDGGDLRGFVRDPAPDVSAVSLPDAADGERPFTMRAGDGEWLIVYFGYTACPDVCPTTLADLRSAVRRLDEGDAARIDVAFVTVDPDRDDADRLTSYIQAFFAGAHALRTDDPVALRATADAFGAAYEVVTTPDGVEVGHSAYLYAIDSSGAIRLQWPFGVTADDLEHDLKQLMSERT